VNSAGPSASGDDVRRLFESAGAPPFEQPWHAQVFAITVELSRAGVFSWPRWTEALGARFAEAGPADSAERYWEHWLAALEALVVECGLAEDGDLAGLASAWHEAFASTPHGAPVSLDVATLERVRKFDD